MYESDPSEFDQLVAPILDPHVEWQTNWPGLQPAARGIEGVRRWLTAFMEPWESIELKLQEVSQLTENLVYLAYVLLGRGAGSGVPVEMEIHDLLTFRDGRVVLRETWTDRQSALAAARGRP